MFSFRIHSSTTKERNYFHESYLLLGILTSVSSFTEWPISNASHCFDPSFYLRHILPNFSTFVITFWEFSHVLPTLFSRLYLSESIFLLGQGMFFLFYRKVKLVPFFSNHWLWVRYVFWNPRVDTCICCAKVWVMDTNPVAVSISALPFILSWFSYMSLLSSAFHICVCSKTLQEVSMFDAIVLVSMHFFFPLRINE